MPLDDLVSVIETLQQRIKDHGDSLRQNETRTRMALIDPLLQALGWDVADPGVVTPEYDVSGQRADYALLNTSGNPSAFVEAKKLGESLIPHRMQMVNYANMSGVPYAGLTDGNNWELYVVFDQKPLEERRLLDLSIANTPAYQCALKFLLLWRPNLASGQPVAAEDPILAGEIPTVTEEEPFVDAPPHAPVPPPGEGWTSFLDLPSDISWRSQPSLIRFPGGEEKAIQWSQWKRVLVEVAEWLIREGALTGDKCPIGQVPERYIIHSEPAHPNGHPFFHPALLSNALYLASAANAKRAASDCIFLMKHCNQDPASVHLKLG